MPKTCFNFTLQSLKLFIEINLKTQRKNKTQSYFIIDILFSNRPRVFIINICRALHCFFGFLFFLGYETASY